MTEPQQNALPIGAALDFWKQNAGLFAQEATIAGLCVLTLAELGAAVEFPPEILEKIPQARMLTEVINKHLTRMGKKSSIIL